MLAGRPAVTALREGMDPIHVEEVLSATTREYCRAGCLSCSGRTTYAARSDYRARGDHCTLLPGSRHLLANYRRCIACHRVFSLICVYRRAINSYVPASLLMALLIGLAAVFFFNYQNILLKDTGLIEYYPHSNDFLGSIEGPIRQAQEDIWFYGTDFNISAGDRRPLLLNKLASGLRLNYLIFDPHSSHLEDLAADFDQSPAELRAECEKGLADLLQLRKEWQDKSKSSRSPGEVNVRVFETHPHARFYVFDSGRTQGRTFFVPYVNGVNSPGVPGFLLANVKDGVFRAYFSSILKMWNQSTDLSAYIQQHPEFAGR